MTEARDLKAEAIKKARMHLYRMRAEHMNGLAMCKYIDDHIMAADVVFAVWSVEGGHDMIAVKGRHLLADCAAMNFTVDAIPAEYGWQTVDDERQFKRTN
jgi:hypothetical protein